MNIGMADAAILDLDRDIVLARIAPFKCERTERSLGCGSSVTFGRLR
jgi:hypothetical protein